MRDRACRSKRCRGWTVERAWGRGAPRYASIWRVSFMFYGNGKEFQLVDLTHFLAVRRTFFQESRGTSITNAPDREFSHDHNPWKRFPTASGRALAKAHF